MAGTDEAKGETRRRLRAQRRRIAVSRDLTADGAALAEAVLTRVPAAPTRTEPTGTEPTRTAPTGTRPGGTGPGGDHGGADGPCTVLSYESLPHEPPTDAVNAALQSAGHRVLVPITLPDMRLDWCDLADPDRTPLGLDRPATADLAVIPALAVDTRGTRLGQGGGCYDRVLPMLAAGTPVLVLLHPGEHTTEVLPRDPHDVAVTTVVTATGVARVDRPLD